MPFMPTCCMRIMRGFLMLSRIVMLSSFTVVLGGLSAVFGCLYGCPNHVKIGLFR